MAPELPRPRLPAFLKPPFFIYENEHAPPTIGDANGQDVATFDGPQMSHERRELAEYVLAILRSATAEPPPP